MTMNLPGLPDRELLRLYAKVMRELRTRGVIRSSNNPVADLAESIAAKAFGLTLEPNSAKGFDGVCQSGKRYQVKGRRITPENRSTELSIIRNLDDNQFDFLLAIYFDEEFGIDAAYRIIHAAVAAHTTYSKHSNGHRFTMKEAIKTDHGCEDVTAVVRGVWL